MEDQQEDSALEGLKAGFGGIIGIIAGIFILSLAVCATCGGLAIVGNSIEETEQSSATEEY